MSKYENSTFPYSVPCSTVNLRAWRPKDTNVTLMSVLCLFIEPIPFCDVITKIETCLFVTC